MPNVKSLIDLLLYKVSQRRVRLPTKFFHFFAPRNAVALNNGYPTVTISPASTYLTIDSLRTIFASLNTTNSKTLVYYEED